MDSQQIELIGRAELERKLIRNGFEIARPNRDKGIDLFVYLDSPEHSFRAVPIQLKSYTKPRFGVDRKYEKMNGIVLAYVWEIHTDRPRLFMMDYNEAVGLLDERNLQSLSWANGGYSKPHITSKLNEEMERYEMIDNCPRWEWLTEKLRK